MRAPKNLVLVCRLRHQKKKKKRNFANASNMYSNASSLYAYPIYTFMAGTSRIQTQTRAHSQRFTQKPCFNFAQRLSDNKFLLPSHLVLFHYFFFSVFVFFFWFCCCCCIHHIVVFVCSYSILIPILILLCVLYDSGRSDQYRVRTRIVYAE